MLKQPTEIGKKRYPPNGTYDGELCTCTEQCKDPCDGTNCDCDACCCARNDAYDAQFYEPL